MHRLYELGYHIKEYQPRVFCRPTEPVHIFQKHKNKLCCFY